MVDTPELVSQMGAVGVIVILWVLTWRWVLTRLSDDLGRLHDRLEKIEQELHDK